MRTPVIRPLFTAFLLAAAVAYASAEVIHLKNGRTIWADHVRDTGTHIEYDLGDNTYAIPKSLVDRVDAGGSPPESAPADLTAKPAHDLPEFAPADNLKNDPTLIGKIIQDGRVDPDALSALEQADNASAAAAGYFIAGKHEFDHGNFSKARTYFESGLRFDSQNPTILNYYAALLVRTGNAPEALPYAERAVRAAPDSPDALAVLGYVQFAADRTQEAIRSWKHSLELRPDATVQKYLEKAQRDATTEADYAEHESSHFTLRYEGKQTSEALRGQLLASLESEYDDLVRELGIAPRNNIPVVLYTEQSFFDVTQAPSWSGAVFDGKLRIPINGLTSVTPELARVLKHELAHSFISQLSGGRCPQWLNEGIAQAVEPKQIAHGQLLADLFRTQREISLNALEGSFMQFSSTQATVAYEESLAAVQYIRDTYGMSDLQRILERLGQGSSTEAALRATIHSDYGQLEAEVGKYLIGKYGH
ncbi:MAG TPA: tetratricopeptide repeat protein [Terriglobales bacterium]|nr:tetratricopeptide repeat protein [Terriglobales bacterium]